MNFVKKWYNNYLIKILTLIIIIGAGWFGFIYLADWMEFEESSALVMVWVSILLLIFAFFPSILNRIKRFKYKDLEIELSEVVEKAIEEQHIQLDDFDDPLFTHKGNFFNLIRTFKTARINPDRPVILTANIGDGTIISITTLFLYLFLFDVSGISVSVLFYKSNEFIKEKKFIKENCIIGFISGKKLMNILAERYKWLLKLYKSNSIDNNNNNELNISLDELISDSFTNSNDAERLLRNIELRLSNFRDNNDEVTLREKTVNNLTGKNLNRRIIDLETVEKDFTVLTNALEKSDEFVILTKDGTFKTVLALCKVARIISLKAIKNYNN